MYRRCNLFLSGVLVALAFQFGPVAAQLRGHGGPVRALIFLIWIAGNIPNRVDIEWFRRGGGLVGEDHPPAHRFNGGQKLIYWIVVLGGGAAAVRGYVLIFPFYGTTVETIQEAEMVHAVVAMLFIAAMLAHISIGTIGMEGAFEAMGTGTVDFNWARNTMPFGSKKRAPRTRQIRRGRSPRQRPGNNWAAARQAPGGAYASRAM